MHIIYSTQNGNNDSIYLIIICEDLMLEDLRSAYHTPWYKVCAHSMVLLYNAHYAEEETEAQRG